MFDDLMVKEVEPQKKNLSRDDNQLSELSSDDSSSGSYCTETDESDYDSDSNF